MQRNLKTKDKNVKKERKEGNFVQKAENIEDCEGGGSEIKKKLYKKSSNVMLLMYSYQACVVFASTDSSTSPLTFTIAHSATVKLSRKHGKAVSYGLRKDISFLRNGVGRGYLVAITESTWQLRDVRGCQSFCVLLTERLQRTLTP